MLADPGDRVHHRASPGSLDAERGPGWGTVLERFGRTDPYWYTIAPDEPLAMETHQAVVQWSGSELDAVVVDTEVHVDPVPPPWVGPSQAVVHEMLTAIRRQRR